MVKEDFPYGNHITHSWNGGEYLQVFANFEADEKRQRVDSPFAVGIGQRKVPLFHDADTVRAGSPDEIFRGNAASNVRNIVFHRIPDKSKILPQVPRLPGRSSFQELHNDFARH